MHQERLLAALCRHTAALGDLVDRKCPPVLLACCRHGPAAASVFTLGDGVNLDGSGGMQHIDTAEKTRAALRTEAALTSNCVSREGSTLQSAY